ncbi:MAG TPA: hypothetical protein VFZ59_08890 [Verrucomicrobiae bacterium]|nr:hypothetical protein [Verrucomicrobiae bacterium]
MPGRSDAAPNCIRQKFRQPERAGMFLHSADYKSVPLGREQNAILRYGKIAEHCLWMADSGHAQ